MRKFAAMLIGLCFFVVQAVAQNRVIIGTVLDEAGNPISSATVLIKGTTRGVRTTSNGAFTITVSSDTKILTISYVGFTTKDVVIGSSTNLSISLEATASNLDEVVVSTGISKQRKSQFAGAATSISKKNIENRPVGSFDQLLQGQVPGLLAVTTSGQPGNNANITIRGSSSIAGGSNPLYVVDGIPVEAAAFQGLNPNDFESFDILKDATASALYGSRGSAGVIVITTKKGSNEKMKLSYNAQIGQKSKPEFAFRPMNTTELLKAQEDYGRIAGGGAAIPGWYYSKSNPRYATLTAAQQAQADFNLDSISKINTNWSDYIFKTGTFSNHQISLAGGTGKTHVYSSIELYNEDGTTARTDMQRLSLRNNVDYADDKLSFSLTSSFAYTARDFQQSTTTNSTGNPFLAVSITPPTSAVYKTDGTYATGTGAAFVGANELDLNKYDANYNSQIKGVLGINAAYKITKNVTAAVTGGIDFRETQNSNYGSKLAYSRTVSTTAQGSAGFQTEGLTRYFQGDVRPSLSFDKTFAQKHRVSVSAYGEYIGQFTKTTSETGYGIDPRTPNTPAAITQGDASNLLFSAATGSKSQNALYSGLGTASYSFEDKYSLSGSFRYDGSSKLPKVNRWVGFYSVSGLWNVHKENFLKNSKFVDVLRIRASYGGSGNNDNFPFGDFGYLPTFAANGNYSGLTTLYVTSVGNPALTWEKVYQLNLGLDYSLLHNRIYGSVDVYDKRTKDLFVQKQLSAEAGGYTITVNGGQLQNQGIEFIVGIDVVKTRNFTWTLNGNFAYNGNKVLSLGGLNSYTSGTSLVAVGKPLGSHYEVKWAGVDAASGAPLYYKLDGSLTTVYSTADKVQNFGTYEAPWKGGFGTNFHYKAFDLSTLFSWQSGGTKEDNLEYFVENPVGFLSGGYNQSSSLNFWKKPGDVATTPSPLYSTNFSSKIIHNASFLRFRDITVTYTLPASTAKRTQFISRLSFYAQASNLFIWTKWRGFDPEAGPVNINLSEYPNPRAFTGGINLTF